MMGAALVSSELRGARLRSPPRPLITWGGTQIYRLHNQPPATASKTTSQATYTTTTWPTATQLQATPTRATQATVLQLPRERREQPAAARAARPAHGLKESVLYRAAGRRNVRGVHARAATVRVARAAYRTGMHACILGASFRATVSCSNTRLTQSAPPPHTHAHAHTAHTRTHPHAHHTHTHRSLRKKKKSGLRAYGALTIGEPGESATVEDVRALMDRAEEELEGLEDALGQRLGGFADKSLWDVHVRARAPSRGRRADVWQTRAHCSGGRLTGRSRRLACLQLPQRGTCAGTCGQYVVSACSCAVGASHTTAAVTTTARTAAYKVRVRMLRRPRARSWTPTPHTLPRVRALCTHPRPRTVRRAPPHHHPPSPFSSRPPYGRGSPGGDKGASGERTPLNEAWRRADRSAQLAAQGFDPTEYSCFHRGCNDNNSTVCSCDEASCDEGTCCPDVGEWCAQEAEEGGKNNGHPGS